MADLGWLTTYDPRMFVAQAIERAIERDLLTDEVQDKLVRDAASISHHLMILRFQTTSARYAARQGVEEAVRTVNIGLQFASGGDLERAANLISKNELVVFFKIGNTLINRLKREAKELLKKNLIHPPRSIEALREDVALIDAVPVEIFNVLEKRFLEELLDGVLTAREEGGAVKLSGGGGRPMISLEDVRLAQKVLGQLRLKSEYARSLPARGFFTTKFLLDPTLDFILAATRHLMANLVLKGEIGYKLSSEEAEDFKGRIKDKSVRTLLLKWIEGYMERRNKGEELRGFARRYWLKAMSDIESFGTEGYR
jgi:hypothetical protein